MVLAPAAEVTGGSGCRQWSPAPILRPRPSGLGVGTDACRAAASRLRTPAQPKPFVAHNNSAMPAHAGVRVTVSDPACVAVADDSSPAQDHHRLTRWPTIGRVHIRQSLVPARP